MNWERITPRPGDMIRAKVGPLHHYGIYVSDEEVIQFGPNPSLRKGVPDTQLQVCVSDIDNFLCGEFLEVCVPDPVRLEKQNPPEKVVEIARSRIGQNGYHILHNNCEHFANECITGEHFSSQTDSLRKHFGSLHPVDVYTAVIPEGEMGEVLPQLRQEQIENTNHPGLKRQRYYVWKLLEYALQHSFGYEMKNLHFSRIETGKWTCEECFFSLSHTRDGVAVAVSRKPVGVDIECLEHQVSPKLADKILTDEEKKQLPATEQNPYLLEMWCAKESLFKAGSDPVFYPQKLSARSGVKTQTVQLGEKKFCLAVACDNLQNVRIHENISL